MNRSLTVIAAALLWAALGAGCNQGPASDTTADSNTSQDSHAKAGTAKGSKEGGFASWFESSKDITIPQGTSFEVTVDETLASNRNSAGDSFQATLAQPVVVDGQTIIPAGAPVTGHVVDAKDAGRLHVPARLSVALNSVEVEGKTYDIETNTIGETGRNHNKRNAGFIGGGAAGGALIGGLAGGGKGALIGTLLGAGAGTAGAAATGKKDTSLPAETRLRFQLTRTVTVSVKR